MTLFGGKKWHLGELGNGVYESPFADDLAIYITTRNQRKGDNKSTANYYKQDVLAVERGPIILSH